MTPPLDWIPVCETAQQDTGLISVVEDDESVRDGAQALLRSVGYRVRTFGSAESLLASKAPTETACLILDIRIPGTDGLELQRRLNESETYIPTVFITAQDDSLARKTAIAAGAVDVLRKPFLPGVLLAAVQIALGRGGAASHGRVPRRAE